jgi:hypothetical protein
MQAASTKLDLVPLQVTDFRCPQSVPVGDQDHGGIAVAVTAVFAGCRHKLLDLGRGQIFPGPAN